MLCMWILLLLSIFSISVGYAVRQKIKVIERIENRQKLRRIAESGFRKALYVLNLDQNAYDAWTDLWNDSEKDFKDIAIGDGSVSVLNDAETPVVYGISDEEAKININLVQSPIVFRRLFHEGLGMDTTFSNQLAELILDWRDEDDNPYESGAETMYYKTLNPPYRAKNSDFAALEELRFVKNITAEVYNQVSPYLSVDSTGKINLNTASKPVLRAMGFSEALAGKLIAFRLGADGIRRTEDDNVLADSGNIIEAINQFSALNEDEKVSLKDFIESGLFTIKSSYFKIKIEANLENRQTAMTATGVVERDDAGIKIVSWRESYHV